MKMKPAVELVYNIKDKPPVGVVILSAIQQLLAIMVATIAVPAAVGNGMTASAALFGAGVGTIVYLLFTKNASPVFLGSSFAFIGPMLTAFAGAASMAVGYAGLIIGAVVAGLIYVIIALVVRFCGVGWISKLMPPVIIGPVVACIGLSLSGYAVSLLTSPSIEGGSTNICLLCGLITLAVAMACATYGNKNVKLIPFMIGIIAGYAVASVLYLIGRKTGTDNLCVISYAPFAEVKSFIAFPEFSFLKADWSGVTGGYLLTLFVAYAPVAFVVFAEHLADHKNLSVIIGKDLLEEPGLYRTLLGDGIGSVFGTVFGGCPNTTYGESIACVAITGNASISTIFITAIYCIILSFFHPFVSFVNSIPSCIVGGVCIALYGFIAVSGLKMLQPVDLNDNRNLFVVAAILVCGIGGLTLNFGSVQISAIATALIVGILVNVLFNRRAAKEKAE